MLYFELRHKILDGIKIVETSNYFVSFIDILGFKNLINKQVTSEDIHKTYDSLERTLFYLSEAYIHHRDNKFFRF